MALSTPTILQISNDIINDIDAKTGQTTPLLAKAVFRVLSLALAAVYVTLYKFGLWQFNQRFPQTASETFLSVLGEIVDINIVRGTQFEGDVQVTVQAIGNTLPAGTQLINNATGVIYLTTVDVLLSNPTETVSIKSTTSGEETSLEVSDIIDFVTPLSFVDREAVVTAVTTLGTDDEPLEQYRQRVIDRYQKTPQGGALADYEQWSEEVADVINAYPYAGLQPPDVNVYIEVDNQPDGIPTAPQLAAVENSINYDPITGQATRRPVTAVVSVLPITRLGFNVEITGLSPDTTEIRNAIETAVIDYFLTAEPYIQGLSTIRLDVVTQSGVSAAAANVASVNEAFFSNLVLKLGTVVTPQHVLEEGEKAKLDTLTFL